MSETKLLLEWFGYLASIIIAISLTMSSIIRLRWFNFVGAAMLSIYGFLIEAYPVGFLNFFIAAVDIYYLVKIYTSKDEYKILDNSGSSEYFKYFIEHYREDIVKFFPDFNMSNIKDCKTFFILNNMNPVSVIIAKEIKEGEYEIIIDYAIPAYRDCKVGRFFFCENTEYLRKLNIKKFIINTSNKVHIDYILKIGFMKLAGNNITYVKEIN